MHSSRMLRAFALALITLAAFAGATSTAFASSPFPVSESFTGPASTVPTPPWYAGGSTSYTGTNSTPGWLRLTSALGNEFGYMVNDTAFPSTNGMLESFDYASYGGTGADGLTFFLYNGSTTAPGSGATGFAPGPSGGDLGYASCPSSAQAGLTNAYVGVGFDEYGNFSNTGFCGLSTGYAAGLNPERITVRGGAGSNPTSAASYPYITSAAVASGETLVGSSESQYRHVTVAVQPSGKLSVYVTYPDGVIQRVISGYQMPAMPATLKFGWVASTGGSTDYHEIRNSLTALPAQLAVTGSGPSQASRSGTLTYTFTVSNNGENATTANSVYATSTSPLQNISWTCASSTGTCGAASGTGMPSTTADLPVGASATYTITAQPTSSTDTANVTLEADPTGAFAQTIPGTNVATLSTLLSPAQAPGTSTAPQMALSNTNGYTGSASLTHGTYLGGSLTITDNWQHCAPDGSACSDITGATAATYTPGAGDRGYTLRVREHVANAAGASDFYSAAYSPLPVTSFTSTPPGVSSSSSATFALASSRTGSAYECALDGSAPFTYTSCSSSPSFNGLADGLHTLRVRAVWGGLSDPTGASYTWRVDTTPPVDTSSCSTGWSTSATPCTVQGTDPGSGVSLVQWYVDSGATQSGPVGSSPAFSDGTHVLHTRVQDVAGNFSSWRATSLNVDGSTPADTSTCGAPDGQNGWYVTAPTCTVQGTDATSGIDHVSYQLDGGSIVSTAPGTASTTVAISGDGTHTLKTEVFNPAGTGSGWTSRTIKLDATAPSDTSSCLANAAGWSSVASPCAVAGADTTSGVADVQWYVDSGAVQTDPAGGSPSFTDGTHTLHTRVQDIAGNASPWNTTTVNVDTAGPLDTSSCPSPDGQNGWYVSAPTCSIAGTDATSGVDHLTYQLDSAPASSTAPGTPSATVTVTGDGAHTLNTQAFDIAGNASGASVHTLNLDTTAPSDSSTCSPGWSTDPQPCTVQGSDSGSGLAEVQWALDGGPVQTGPSGSRPTLPAGPHTIVTRAEDQAGNFSSWQSETADVDTSSPVDLSSCGTPDGQNGWFVSAPTCTVQGSDPVSGIDHVSYQLDGGPVTDTAPGTAKAAVTISGDGAHTLRTRVFNLAGADSGWTSQTVRLSSTAPPAPVVLSPGDGSSTGDHAPVVRLSAAPGSRDAIYIDGQLVGSVTADPDGAASLQLAAPLPAGPHSIYATATDGAGNVSTHSSTDGFTVVDGTQIKFTPMSSAPTTTAPPTLPYAGHPGDSYTITLDGRTVASGTIGSSGTGAVKLPQALTRGTHVIVITARNAAGQTALDKTILHVAAPAVAAPAVAPVKASPPVISGRPLPGSRLNCSTGQWTGRPSGFTYQWYRGSSAVEGASGELYTVSVADQGAALTCRVLATNGNGSAAASHPVVVAQPGTLLCPQPSGAIVGDWVGPLELGMSPRTARSILHRYVVTSNHFDDFCLYGGWGIRVGYPSPELLSATDARAGLAGRVVIALSANPYYSLAGVRVGMDMAQARRILPFGRAFHIGLNYWFIARRPVANAVVKVRGGVIQEVGLVDKRLTRGRLARALLLGSFHR